jgi:hypothetical protein
MSKAKSYCAVETGKHINYETLRKYSHGNGKLSLGYASKEFTRSFSVLK